MALESISFGPAARFWQRFKRHLAPAGGWRRCRGDGAANPAVNLGQFYSDPLNLRRGFPLAEICLLHYRDRNSRRARGCCCASHRRAVSRVIGSAKRCAASTDAALCCATRPANPALAQRSRDFFSKLTRQRIRRGIVSLYRRPAGRHQHLLG